MTVFTELPSAMTLLRTILAIGVFGFLPGYLLLLRRSRAKNFSQPLNSSLPETVFESTTVSVALLSLSVMLLTFSVGFSLEGLLLLEMIILFGAWFYWRKSRK